MVEEHKDQSHDDGEELKFEDQAQKDSDQIFQVVDQLLVHTALALFGQKHPSLFREGCSADISDYHDADRQEEGEESPSGEPCDDLT